MRPRAAVTGLRVEATVSVRSSDADDLEFVVHLSPHAVEVALASAGLARVGPATSTFGGAWAASVHLRLAPAETTSEGST